VTSLKLPINSQPGYGFVFSTKVAPEKTKQDAATANGTRTPTFQEMASKSIGESQHRPLDNYLQTC
jgi:hypothetical protein